MELKTYQSKYYHNEHSKQRDRFLIHQFGEDWLINMKKKGHFQGDFPENVVGTLKDGKNWRSVGFDTNGNILKLKEVNIDASCS